VAYEHAYATEKRRIEHANLTLVGVKFVFLLLYNNGFPTENYPALRGVGAEQNPPRPTTHVYCNQESGYALRATKLIK
jgi:hypothetical protein